MGYRCYLLSKEIPWSHLKFNGTKASAAGTAEAPGSADKTPEFGLKPFSVDAAEGRGEVITGMPVVREVYLSIYPKIRLRWDKWVKDKSLNLISSVSL